MKGYFGEYKIMVEKGVINLPDKWNMDGEVVMVGCGDHMEIWEKETYDEKLNEIF